jgi:ribosomal protein L23
MNHLVFLIRNNIEEKNLKNIISNIFNVKPSKINELLESKESLIKYEITMLDSFTEFNFELNIYIQNELSISVKESELFSIAKSISSYIDDEVIIETFRDDPYQWVLVSNNIGYLVEEKISNGNYGLNIDRSSIKPYP